jgi:hypothetical protein
MKGRVEGDIAICEKEDKQMLHIEKLKQAIYIGKRGETINL